MCEGLCETYLLVDEILVVVLDIELALHFLDLGAFQEELPLHSNHLLASDLALAHQRNQLPCILKLFTESSELVGALCISAASLANLANFAPAETDKRIAVVGILAGFKLTSKSACGLGQFARLEYAYLEARLQWMVPIGSATSLPVLVDVFGEAFHALLYGGIHGIFHVCKGQYRRTVYSCIWLLRLRRLLKEVHGCLEIILGTLVGRVALLVENLQKHIILLSHVIRTSATILDGRGEADVRRRLRKVGRVKFVISQVTEDGFGSGNMRLVDLALGSGIDRYLQVEFLCDALHGQPRENFVSCS